MIRAFMRRVGRVAAGLALASVMLLATPGHAWAGDKVYLKDGRVIEGEIVREVDGSVWVKYSIGGIEQQGFFGAVEIDRIERDAASDPAPSAPVRRADENAGKTPAKRPGEVRGVVITLEGMVGVEFAAKPLEDAIPWLEEHEVDVVVLKVNSGGGYLLEIPKMHELIQEKYKKQFRTVAWIESAISAAAMSSHVLEEVYFMTDGNYGACTGWSGALVAVEGLGLERALYMMEKASAWGKKAPQIMRSMQIEDPLSYNRSKDGEITWFNTEEGETVVNPSGRILTFDSVQAAGCKFSKGTCDDVRTLAGLMGYHEVNWLGDSVPGEVFPISQPERDMRAWRAGVSEANERLGEYFVKYQTAVQNAASEQDPKVRGSLVGVARQHLAVIKRVAKSFPNLAYLNNLTEEWFKAQEKTLRDLLRP